MCKQLLNIIGFISLLVVTNLNAKVLDIEGVYLESFLDENLHYDDYYKGNESNPFNSLILIESKFNKNIIDDNNYYMLSMDSSIEYLDQKNYKIYFRNKMGRYFDDPYNGDEFFNELKELYLSFYGLEGYFFDIGRINVNNGIALGYKPNDYLKNNHYKEGYSSPDTQRNNRLGTVAVRGTKFWDRGNLSLLYSPKLSDQLSANPRSLDFYSTNGSSKTLLTINLNTSTVAPQFSFFKENGESVQIGMNLSKSIAKGGISYFEWSGGKSHNEYDKLLNNDRSKYRWYNQVAIGGTWTTEKKLSFTLEYLRDGRALEKNQINSLSSIAPNSLFFYKRTRYQNLQLVGKQAVLFKLDWFESLSNKVDVSSLIMHDLEDKTDFYITEVKCRGNVIDSSLQYVVRSDIVDDKYLSINFSYIF